MSAVATWLEIAYRIARRRCGKQHRWGKDSLEKMVSITEPCRDPRLSASLCCVRRQGYYGFSGAWCSSAIAPVGCYHRAGEPPGWWELSRHRRTRCRQWRRLFRGEQPEHRSHCDGTADTARALTLASEQQLQFAGGGVGLVTGVDHFDLMGFVISSFMSHCRSSFSMSMTNHQAGRKPHRLPHLSNREQ